MTPILDLVIGTDEEALNNLWDPFRLDLFARRHNSQLENYISWGKDPFAQGTDALQVDGRNGRNLCVSSIQSNSQSSVQDTERQSNSGLDNTGLASTSLVPDTV